MIAHAALRQRSWFLNRPKSMTFIPLLTASGLIADYLEASSHGGAEASSLFQPLHNSRDRQSVLAITPDGVYRMVRKYSGKLGFEIGAHSLRATAATNALDH
jgi:integrase/recombinase XerD